MYFHSFSFDTLADARTYGKMDYQVLDYKYGDSNQLGTRPEQQAREVTDWLRAQAVHGEMQRGTSLYVKWRNVITGHVSERLVDLQTQLPVDVTGFGIHFLIDDDQLYVFLIPPPGQWQRDMFYKQDPEYQAYRKAHQIYPTTSDLS